MRKLYFFEDDSGKRGSFYRMLELLEKTHPGQFEKGFVSESNSTCDAIVEAAKTASGDRDAIVLLDLLFEPKVFLDAAKLLVDCLDEEKKAEYCELLKIFGDDSKASLSCAIIAFEGLKSVRLVFASNRSTTMQMNLIERKFSATPTNVLFPEDLDNEDALEKVVKVLEKYLNWLSVDAFLGGIKTVLNPHAAIDNAESQVVSLLRRFLRFGEHEFSVSFMQNGRFLPVIADALKRLAGIYPISTKAIWLLGLGVFREHCPLMDWKAIWNFSLFKQLRTDIDIIVLRQIGELRDSTLLSLAELFKQTFVVANGMRESETSESSLKEVAVEDRGMAMHFKIEFVPLKNKVRTVATDLSSHAKGLVDTETTSSFNKHGTSSLLLAFLASRLVADDDSTDSAILGYGELADVTVRKVGTHATIQFGTVGGK